MRVSLVSILLAGGTLALGACSTSTEPMTLAERTEQCRARDVSMIPTGRETGDARKDYRCATEGFRNRDDVGIRQGAHNNVRRPRT